MIYGVPLLLQEAEITHYCFGVCGRVALAGIDSDIAGPLVPCSHADCEYCEKESDVVGEAFGDELKLRKLVGVIL